MVMQTLPAKWTLKNGFLKDETNYKRYVLDENGRLDREKIMTILENHGYTAHARCWTIPIEWLEVIKASKEYYLHHDIFTDPKPYRDAVLMTEHRLMESVRKMNLVDIKMNF